MNTYIINLSEKDVLSMDDNTGDIEVYRKHLPSNIKENDFIKIQYEEDEDTICHKYRVDNIDEVVTLEWVEQLEESLLRERSFDKKLSRAIKQGLKTEQQMIKRARKLFERDMKKGQNWLFYIQKEDGTYEEPKTLAEVRDLYSKNYEPLSPKIANAIVTDDKGFMIRRGMQDMTNTAVRYKEGEKPGPGYFIEWDKKETTQDSTTDSQEAQVDAKTDEKTETKNNKEQQLELTPIEQRVITQKLLDKFSKLAIVAELQVWDPNNKVVDFKKQKITPDNVSDYRIRIDNTLYKLPNWLIRANKEKALTEDCNIRRCAKLILESPMITLSKDDLMDPSSVNLKGVTTRALEREAEAQAKLELQNKKNELKEKYGHVEQMLNLVSTNKYDEDLLSAVFDELVPSSGAADTVAGELVRAIMRLLYRAYNDGDIFFVGYGRETAGPSATYIRDHGFEDAIDEILADPQYYVNNDDKYYSKLEELVLEILRAIKNDSDLLYTPNVEDSRNSDAEWLEEYEPKYDLDIYPSDVVEELLEKKIISNRDIYDYVYNIIEYEPTMRDAEVESSWHGVTVCNLTSEGYEQLEYMLQAHFWDDLEDEFADELDSYDEEEYDDDYEKED